MFIRVLLADDSRIMRDAIRSFLSGHSEIALVGEAVDFSQTIGMVCDLRGPVRDPPLLQKTVLIVLSLALIAGGTPGLVAGQTPPSYKPAELDKLVSRIALYPDPLLAQILAAATYPDQIPYGIDTKCSSPAGAGNGLGSTAAPTCIMTAISIVGPGLVAWSTMN